MIVARLNLRCAAGHRHWSPTPQAWVGEPCSTPLGADRRRRCNEPLRRIRKRRP